MIVRHRTTLVVHHGALAPASGLQPNVVPRQTAVGENDAAGAVAGCRDVSGIGSEARDRGRTTRRQHQVLRRAGVVTLHGKRPHRQPTSPPRVEALAPNDHWSMASKGWFRVGDGTRSDPLTIHDLHSRASLVC